MDKVTLVKTYLHYEPETGDLTWAKQSGRQRKGKRAGSVHSAGYIELRCMNIRMFAHQAAWAIVTGKWPEFQIDHINGMRDDNRWENLREARQVQNSANMMRRPSNRSGYKGVSINKRGKFLAYIHINGKTKYLGTYVTAKEAHGAYCKAAQDAWGVYASAG